MCYKYDKLKIIFPSGIFTDNVIIMNELPNNGVNCTKQSLLRLLIMKYLHSEMGLLPRTAAADSKTNVRTSAPPLDGKMPQYGHNLQIRGRVRERWWWMDIVLWRYTYVDTFRRILPLMHHEILPTTIKRPKIKNAISNGIIKINLHEYTVPRFLLLPKLKGIYPWFKVIIWTLFLYK